MQLEEARELLSRDYCGEHTLLVFAKPQTARINKTSRFGKHDQSVYLFPGTLSIDDTVIGYSPVHDDFGMYSLSDVVLVKTVTAFLDKNKILKQKMHENESFIESFYDFTSTLSNKYYKGILMGYVNSMSKKEPISEERQQVAIAVIKELLKTNKSEFLEKLYAMVRDYFVLCKISSSLTRRDEMVEAFIQRSKENLTFSNEQIQEFKTRFLKTCKKESLISDDVVKFVKAKVVAQVMVIEELVESKEIFTFEEVIEALKKHRLDIANNTESSMLLQSVCDGLRKLVIDGLVEQNLLLNTYSLTAVCRAIALQFIGIDNP